MSLPIANCLSMVGMAREAGTLGTAYRAKLFG